MIKMKIIFRTFRSDEIPVTGGNAKNVHLSGEHGVLQVIYSLADG